MASSMTVKTMAGRATSANRGGLLLAALALVGVLGAAAGEVRAQPWGGWRGGGFEQAAYQGRERDRYGGREGGDFRGGGGRRAGFDGGPVGYGGPAGGNGWRRGQVLPPDYRARDVTDPGRYHLRPPPSGYGWVGDQRNAYLMQRSTGMVLDAVPGAYEPAPRYTPREGRGRRGRR